MRSAVRSIFLGVLTTLLLAALLAAFVPVPMYPRPIVRVWLDSEGRAVSGSEVRLPGVHDIWWDDVEVGLGISEQQAASGVSDHLDNLAIERRGTAQEMRRREGPPPVGTFRGRTPADAQEIGSDTAYGFPLPCLWYSVRGQTAPTASGVALANERLVGGLRLAGEPSARGRDFRALPYLPIWGRLLADVAFWGAFWWLIIGAGAAMRRRRRRRRGLCTRCGYDLIGLAPDPGAAPACPECGASQAASPTQAPPARRAGP